MGKVLSVISRPIKNYNIENRAHKIISKPKPTPAPGYKANIEAAEKLLQENPDSLAQLLRKDAVLDTHLKEVYVKSYNPEIVESTKNVNPDRPLPLNRRIIVQPEFGFTEPKVIPPGRITLRQVLKLLTEYHRNQNTWDSTKESLNYNVSNDIIDNITKYFRLYQVFIPEENKKVVYGAPKLPKENEKLKSGVE